MPKMITYVRIEKGYFKRELRDSLKLDEPATAAEIEAELKRDGLKNFLLEKKPEYRLLNIILL